MHSAQTVRGLHHITAVAHDAQANAAFYVGVLGLRMVKRTVNQDAPETYHLFYADAKGNPGTDLTFFIWPDLARGRIGVGQTVEVGFSVPAGTLPAWRERLEAHGVAAGPIESRFSEAVLSFADPDGLPVALFESDGAPGFVTWPASPVPEAEQIRGFHSVRLLERDARRTVEFLTGTLGFEEHSREGEWRRLVLPGGGASRIIDLRVIPNGSGGALGKGSVHHIAWNVGSDEEQIEFRGRLVGAGVEPTTVIDRFWFRSVYFREPGGALFEAATAGPGFLIDEAEGTLGSKLILPPRFEHYRAQIEAALPPFSLPQPVPSA